MHVLITGATGYLGSATVRRLVDAGHTITAMCRRADPSWPASVTPWVVPDLCALDTGAGQRLAGVDCVIHCAARVHVLKDRSSNPLDEFRKVNVRATLNLAELAVAAGVPRFVFISSIGVNGDSSGDQAFRAEDAPEPVTPYAVSKWEAEQALLQLAVRTGIQVIALRPPLIYGRDAPGNFALLCKAVSSGLPLPLGALRQQRSFMSLDNMVDLLAHLVQMTTARSGVYLVSDGQDVSTSDFIRLIAMSMGRRCLLLPVPEVLLEALASLVGRAEQVRKMAVPLRLDISRTICDFAWSPPWTVQQSMQRALDPQFDAASTNQLRSDQ